MSNSTMKHRHKSADEQDKKPEVFGPSEAEGRQFGGDAASNATAMTATRNAIRNKVTFEYKHTVERSLLAFEGMVAGDEQASLEVKPDIIGALQKKLIEKIVDKGKEAVKDALGIGEKLGGALTAVYGAVEGAVDKQVEKEDKLTAIKAVRAVVASVLEATDAFTAQAGAIVDSLSDDVLLSAASVLGAVQGAKDDEDADPHAGKIAHGLETWALEEKLGLPATGGAVIHDLAKHYYLEFRTEVRAAKPVHEQAEELGELDKLPGQTEQKAEKAEEKLGKSTVAEVETDTKERQRVKDL